MLLLNPFRGSGEAWQAALIEAIDGLEVRIWPDIGAPEDIEFIMIGRIDLAELPQLPNLKLMVSLYAGVEGLLANPSLPDAPLVKAEPMTGDSSLTEYAITHVLRHHRNLPAYQAQQARHQWNGLPHKRAAERTVGFLGYGLLSKPMADLLTYMNFNVIAWTRTPKPDAPIEVFHGTGGFAPFLERSEITVCMLPLTSETEGILNAAAFARMPAGAAIINLGRGAHVFGRGAGSGPSGGGDPGCHIAGTAAAGKPALGPSESDHHAARGAAAEYIRFAAFDRRKHPAPGGRRAASPICRSGCRLLMLFFRRLNVNKNT
jgi:glyoxylate/hydroxypyruvate reductase A